MGISGASLLRVAASIAVDITIVPHDVAVLKWRTVVCILQVEKLRLCIHYKMASKSKSVPREFWLTVCAVEEANAGEGFIRSIGFPVKCPAGHNRGSAVP